MSQFSGHKYKGFACTRPFILEIALSLHSSRADYAYFDSFGFELFLALRVEK